MTTHSHGAGDVQQKDKIARYFQQVSQNVDEVLRRLRDPLILAGVDYLQSIYRQVNHPSNLVAAAIKGNPDEWSESQIVAHAKPIVASLYDANVKQALADYKAVNNTPRVTRAFKDIVRAASAGRIETLFVAQDAERWGLFNAETQQVQSRSQPKPDDEPLLNLAAVEVLRQRGQVVALPRSKGAAWSGDGGEAAVVRTASGGIPNCSIPLETKDLKAIQSQQKFDVWDARQFCCAARRQPPQLIEFYSGQNTNLVRE